MAKPRLYICFGVQKSGSTLAYQLSRAVAERAGFDQAPLHPDRPGNAFNNQDSDGFAEMLAHAERTDRRMVVLKTHAEPMPSLVRAVLDGTAVVQAHTRDPRDVALSMLDAAARNDAWGKNHRKEPLQSVDDAIVRIRRMVRRHQEWAQLPGTLCLNYERTAFSTQDTVRQIAAHMGVTAAPLRDAMRAKRRFTQFNTGRSQRHLAEMAPEVQMAWYREFSEHIDAYCPAPVGASWPSQIGTRLGRLLRRH